MKTKKIIPALIILLLMTLTACNNNDTTEAKWESAHVHEVEFDFNSGWLDDFYSEDDDVIVGVYEVFDSDEQMIYTINAIFEGGKYKNAKEIIEDDEYFIEEGVETEDYKYEKWTQDPFTGYADSWTTNYTDEAVFTYENDYGIIIENNTTHGQGVVFDYNNGVYTFNVEWYGKGDENKQAAIENFEKVLASMRGYSEAPESDT